MERNRPTQYKKHKQQDPLMVLLLVLLLVCFILAGIGIVKKSAVFETPKVFLLGLRLLKPPGA